MRRIETFSDGVFAIAITLLVLELPFARVAGGDLSRALASHWPSLAAYVVSFGGIGIAWMHHHALLNQVVRLDRTLLLLNLLVLMTIAFLPFPTSLLGDYLQQPGDARTAALLYSGTWTLTGVAMTALWRHACRHPNLLRPELDRDRAAGLLSYLGVATTAYAGFTAVAFLNPIASFALYLPAAVFFVWRGPNQALGLESEEVTRDAVGSPK